MKKLIIVIAVIFLLALGYQYFNSSNSILSPIADLTFVGKNIDLSNKGLTKIATSIGNYTQIETLDISGNNLSGALPSEVGKLQNLKTLNASNNQFTGIPAEIGQLKKLEYLNFSNNQITGVPHELTQLTNLVELDLRGNTLSQQDLDIIVEALGTDVVRY